MGKYDDIINLPHHESTKHPKMPALDRAAQFQPFAALSGHDVAVRKTARLTNNRRELDVNQKEELDVNLQLLRDQLAQKPQAGITYFVPDAKKDGGAYFTVTGIILKIEQDRHQVIMENGTVIPINNIYEIESQVFDNGDC
ncbi:MAG: YolD-like family protein [Lachnospiraceae bacterium]|nr:YolD-like family protein [Lachnospiraceae bacterium]